LNHKLIESKITGAVNYEEYQTMRRSSPTESSDIEKQLRVLESEHSTIRDLTESARVQVLNLAKTWQKPGENEQRELQHSLFPDGLMWSHEKRLL
jgi:hypothetical protein